MRASYLVHVVAGTLSLVAGYVALYSVKGATLHRRAGTVFVYAMLAMCVAGFTMAVGRGVAPAVNVPAALLTAYLVVTSLASVRPPALRGRWLDFGALVVALGVAGADVVFAGQAFANGGSRDGMPAFPFVLFGAVGSLAAAGDVRMLRRSEPLRGAARLARHLWRMSFALFIAAMSFFLGQMRFIVRHVPELAPARPLFALPVLAVLVTMLYWLWRVRVRHVVGGLVPRPAVMAERA